jgi:hypothetical protein
MARVNRHSGFSLVLIGAAGMLFFWATDPRWGFSGGWSSDAIDAARQAWLGTLAGLCGSAAALITGLWLLTRPMV